MANYQVNLGVSANVSQAQQSIQNLQNTLNSIANTKITVDGGSIDTAAQSARLLSEHLAKATNATTGKIDFTALSNSLKAANTDLATLSNNLLAMGPKGQQAFSQVANAVAHAELSTRKANKALQNFGVTLMNTIKWQAASSMIHGVMSAFNSAVSHIEKLDKSLNSIQIVTGKTAGEMAVFAKQAQEASRALSSTTQEYADAALIYFQQGLGEKAIAERTEATLKMAKVTGDAVATVSDQLTAIWNNFDDGSKSLEHYVDVITALGAATASSTDEIADGLQKFAAIAETVGLSYEYAATALATVTSETRQSADVVGTAFKTLFARIQGLNLGETLDDGTTLNKYSEALAKVGIDIKLSNGELKDMNDILDEMGNKWKRLNEDQQVALAQTVGGIRQYNQLIALMDNWDTFKINLEIAENSKGELDKQFEIYQSSIEASAAELKNATQTLYENILSPDMISGFNEALTDTIDLVNTLVENAGGIEGLFKFGGLLLLQTVLPKLQGFLLSAATHLKDFIGYTQAAKMYELDIMAKTAHNVAGTATNQSREPSFLPNTTGIPAVTEDSSSAMMRTQMMKEEAGYTATILDAKKQILALENGFTDKQRQSNKAYSDQVAQEQEALRIAREKQVVAKETAEQNKRASSMRAGASQAGHEAKAAGRAKLEQLERDRLEELSMYKGDEEFIRKKTEEVNAKFDARKAAIPISNEKLDFSGEQTKTMANSFADSGISDTGQALTQQMTQGLTQSTDGSGPAASIENLEKLGQLQAQYNADAAKANGIYAELGNSIGKAGQRTADQQKTLKKTEASFKTLGKEARSGLVTALKQSAAELKAAGKDASKLEKAIQDVSKEGGTIKLGDMNEDELKATQKAVGQLSGGLDEASVSAGELANAMSSDMAAATGQDAKIFQGIAEDAQVAKTGAIEADDAAKRLQQTLNMKPPVISDPFGSIVQGATQATAAFTSFAMGAQMLSTGITTAFDENASSVEKLMGVMMMLQGVMSTVNAIQQAGNLVQTIAVGIKALKIKATQKEAAAMGKETVAEGANTIATTTNSIAKIFNAHASQGIAGVAIAALAAGIVIATVATVAHTLATKKDTEQKEAEAEAARNAASAHQENAQAIHEETEELNKNAAAYRELYKVYEETGEASSDLSKKSYELAVSLDVQNASLLRQQKNYEELNKQIEKNLKLKNKEALEAAKQSRRSAGRAYATSVGASEGYWADNNTVGFWAGEENVGWIQKFLNSEEGKQYKDAGINFTDGKLIAGYKDVEQIPLLMEAFTSLMENQKFLTAAQNANYDVATGTLFESWQRMQDDDGESYDILQESLDLFREQSITTAVTESEIGLADNITEFSQGYIELIDFILKENGILDKQSQQAKDLIKQADEYLLNSDYSELFEKFKASEELPDNVKKYLASLHGGDLSQVTDEEWQLATTVFIDEHASDEHIKTYLDNAQSILDANQLDATINYSANLQSSVKNNKTKADWDAWFADVQKNTPDIYNKLNFADEATRYSFMTMSAEDQAEAIKNATPSYTDAIVAHQNAAATHQSNIDNLLEEESALQATADKQTWLEGAAGSLYNYGTEYVNPFRNNLFGTSTSAETIDPDGPGGVMPYERHTTISGYHNAEMQAQYDLYLKMVKDAIANGVIEYDGELPDENTTMAEGLQLLDPLMEQIVAMINEHYGVDVIRSSEGWRYAALTEAEALAAGFSLDDAITGPGGEKITVSTQNASNDNIAERDGLDLNDTRYFFETPGMTHYGYSAYQQPTPGDYQETSERTSLTTIPGQIESERTQLAEEEKYTKFYDALRFKDELAFEGFENTDEIIAYADALAELKEGQIDNHREAERIALANAKMNRGVEELADNWDDWSVALKSGNESSQDYVIALRNVKKALGDVLDTDVTQLTDDFITAETTLALLEKVAKGDAEALKELQKQAALNITGQIKIDVNDEELAGKLTEINTWITEFPDLEIGASLDSTGMTNAFQALLDAGVVTVDQMNAILDNIGFEPEITYKEMTVAEAKAAKQTAYLKTDTGEYTQVTDTVNLNDTATVWVPVINGKDTSYQGPPDTTLNQQKDNSGGGKPKKTSKTHQTEVMERYKEINDALEDSKKAMDDASRAAEGLWGKARLKEMEKVRNEMYKQLDLLRQRRTAAMTDLGEDQEWLNSIAGEYGITFTFDPTSGNITNYTQIMEGLYGDLRQAEIDAGATIDTEAEQEAIDAINEKISALEEAIGIYDKTKEEINQTDTAIKEMIRSIQEANLEELNLKLEFELMIDESDLELLEYYLGKVSEDIWSMAEAAALMTGQGKDLFGNLPMDTSQIETWIGQFETYQNRYNELLEKYTTIDPKTGETYINQEQFVKALQELQSDILNNLNNIAEMDKTMISYYGDTLAAAGEELSKFTDLMEHHTDVLDHYSSLLEIMGKSKDWERMKLLSKTQVEVAKNSAEVSKANYEMLKAEAEKAKAKYDALDPNDTSYEAQVIRQEWLDAQAAANEAQIKMLEDAEAWAEALKALLETELEELGDNLEKSLAGDFGSLDYMITSMERANSLQEEYLTTTNKIYETNKLMRSAQQEIDKTTNTVAKRRMAQFIEETQQMQNQNKLSQYELDIQQAKYDLLLAEIALEEAQNAKSTVRLSRDSEGNFGYVYTADQNALSEAEQEVADAQNALYNIGLEGANKYTEQYAQTLQEMNDAIRDLTAQWQNHEITSKEEYQSKMLELEEYYGEKLKQFSHLHSIAIQTDSRVASEAWTRDFVSMTASTEQWMNEVSHYASQVTGAFGRYQKGIAEVEEYAGADLESLRSTTEKIRQENEELVNSITDPDNGLLAAMQQEIDKVKTITSEYAKWRDRIQEVINKQEQLAGKINQDIAQETDDNPDNDYKPESGEDPPPDAPPQGDELPSYKTGVLTWKGNGADRIWTDSKGKTYKASSAEGKAIQAAFSRAKAANGGYQGDYWLGWNKLNADVLHQKYGLSTGGYTGDWSGSFGKLAFLHQKELVLNKQDTENMLNAMDLLDHILQMIDLQSASAQLGGILSSPHFSNMNTSALEQQVHIEASFPGVQDRNEIEEAFNNLINKASQYAHRK